MQKYKSIFNLILLFFVIALSIYICFFRLGSSALENWDEAWYGEITRNMIRSGNYIIPYWNKVVLLDKPPLQMWLSSLASLFFGLNEFSLRVVSALSSVLTIVLVTLYALKKWGYVPALLSFCTLALNNIFVWRARSGNIDSLATFLIFLTFIVLVLSHKRKYLILGFLFSLIFLAKASLVVLPVIIFIFHELFFERKKWKENGGSYLKLILITALLPSLWLFAGYLMYGSSFILYYIFKSDQGIATSLLFTFKPDYLLFMYYSLQRRFAYLFVIGLILLMFKIKKKENVLIALYGTALLVLLSFTERNNNWYLMPAIPFWSLTIAYGIHQIIKLLSKKQKLLIPIVGSLMVISLYISVKTFTVNIMSIVNAEGPQDEKKAALYLLTHVKPNHIIIRTDDLYPTIIYYSERKVLSYKTEINQPHATFIGNKELHVCLKNNTCSYIVGTIDDVKNFILKQGSIYQWVQVFKSGNELVMQLKQP